jgi:type II secretion system (T2SS) protein M
VNLRALWASMQQWYAGHSPRDQRIVLGLGILIGLSLVYVGVIDPIRGYRHRVEEELSEGQEEMERAMRFLAAADSLREERLDLGKRLTQAKKRLLPGGSGTLGAAALQERTNALAVEKGVTIQSTQVMREEAADPYKKVAVRLTLSGEVKPLAEMIAGLEYGQQLTIPFLEVTRRGAVAGAKGPRTLQATLEVSGFVSAEEKGRAKEADAGEGEAEGPVANDAGNGVPEAGQPEEPPPGPPLPGEIAPDQPPPAPGPPLRIGPEDS